MTFVAPYSDPGAIQRVAALRKHLLTSGQSPASLRATPADLARFDLVAWDGRFCGIACVDSPIEVVER